MRGAAYPEAMRAKAAALRACGWSLAEISAHLSIPKNTLSGWLRHVTLTESQRRRIQAKAGHAAARGRLLAVEAWRKKIEIWKAGIEAKVKHFGALPFGQPTVGQLVAACCMCAMEESTLLHDISHLEIAIPA